MRVTVWGSRGSLATPGEQTLEVGGNTTCVEVDADGARVILDAGTGLRALGHKLVDEGVRDISICLTHLHLDHIEGLGFFAPFYDPECRIDVWGPPSSVRSLRERIGRYLSSPLFPVEISDLPARIVFRDVPSESWEIGGLRISAHSVAHPGTTLGFRIEDAAAALAFIPDHEPALGVDLASLTSDWISGFPVAEEATLLIHDAQYSESEYAGHVGWGHSSVRDAVEFARIAGAQQLLLFHHDPAHTDDDLDRQRARARELWQSSEAPPELAREGMQIDL